MVKLFKSLSDVQYANTNNKKTSDLGSGAYG